MRRQVRDGSIAYLLSKPYNYIVYQCSIGLGDSLLKMAIERRDRRRHGPG
ncbi:MAG: hypothetical protein R2911_39740 [Caldilineaceae bacterium]